MNEQIEAQEALRGRSLDGLRPKLQVWHYIFHFARTKPLGAVGAAVAVLLIIVAIFAPQIRTQDPYIIDYTAPYASPSSEMLFGGDELGRDVFSRLVTGSRISLRVGLISAFAGCTIGMLIGLASAYYGGVADLLVQRLVDAMIAFPYLVLAIALMAALATTELPLLEDPINKVILALTILFIPITIRIVRSQGLAIKEMDYVLAARAVGAGTARIILRHMAPNVVAIWIVAVTFNMAIAIIAEASLSFLGVGAGPEVPSWGSMLNGATKKYVGVGPWLAVFPGLAIAIVVYSWNLLGDALRDVLDPRLRGSS